MRACVCVVCVRARVRACVRACVCVWNGYVCRTGRTGERAGGGQGEGRGGQEMILPSHHTKDYKYKDCIYNL